MAKFKLPPVSPLIGSELSTFFKTLRNRKIEGRYYFRLINTFLVIFLTTPFHWIDHIYFYFKARKYKFKEDPIIIIGHWRTGTTFLHNLLARDRRMGFVTTYHSVFPNNLLTRFLFRPFMKARIPEKRPGDNVKLSVNLPQEDEFALSNMIPYSYYQFMYFPKHYREYYDKFIRFQGMDRKFIEMWKYNYRKMVIRAMINTGGRIPLLKNPCNTGRLRTLVELFPDARYIITLRNPVLVFLSTRKFFIELLPTLQWQAIDIHAIEEMIFEVFDLIIHDYLSTRHLIPEKNLIEVKFDDYEDNPVTFIEEVYGKFNLNGFEEVKNAIEKYIASQEGYRKNRYAITPELLDTIRNRWGFAMDLWGYDIPENITIVKTNILSSSVGRDS